MKGRARKRGKRTGRGVRGEREVSYICWFTPYMVVTARAGIGGSQEPGTLSRSPTKEQGPKDLVYLLLLSQAYYQGAGIGSGAAGLKLVPIYDSSIVGQWINLMHHNAGLRSMYL